MDNEQEFCERMIEHTQRQIEALKEKEPEKENKTPLGWIPKADGESYIAISGVTQYFPYYGYNVTQKKIYNGIFYYFKPFKTKEEAEAYIPIQNRKDERQKLLNDIEIWKAEKGYGRGNYELYHNRNSGKWDWNKIVGFIDTPLAIRLENTVQMDELIEHFGDRLNLLLEEEN